MKIFELQEEKHEKFLTYEDKVEKAKKTLKLAADMSRTYYKAPLIISYSGGKDSDCLLHIAESCLAPTEYEVFNSHTTLDPPEVVYHIRNQFKRLSAGGVKTTIKNLPTKEQTQLTMWNLIVKHRTLPTRRVRFCCQELKETGTPNRMVALGVRASESAKRQGRDAFGIMGENTGKSNYYSLEHTEEVHREAKDNDPVWDCTLIKTMRNRGNTLANPIYEFTDEELWRYIRENNVEVVSLYENGYKRVGCIGCPLATYQQRMKEFSDYPKYKDAYMRAIERMLEEKRKSGSKMPEGWTDAEAVFNWWMQKYERMPQGQLEFDFDGNIKEF